MTIEERVQAIIVEQLGVDEKEVTESASFIEDLGADSLDTVELVMAFEEEFDIEIPDEDAEEIASATVAISSASSSGISISNSSSKAMTNSTVSKESAPRSSIKEEIGRASCRERV